MGSPSEAAEKVGLCRVRVLKRRAMTDGTDLTQLVGPALASALAARGYDTLTPVQEAVLDEALDGRDLRITSQTGSGKTIAIGFAVRDLLDDLTAQFGGPARPRVLVLAPTRELAKQVSEELSWLYAPLRVRVVAVTGGAGYLDQKRALSSNPAVVVATPGRLRDALERGKIDATTLAAVVLDEADSMLDLGFREDLEAILAKLPAERRSHLVSATFSRDVVALADRFQRDPVHVQGTRLGEANSDIAHVVHLVPPPQRIDALINLLLADEDAKSLVFARTRSDVARIAGELTEAGFVVRTLSGEMEQPERDRALAAFRSGGVQALVATDVAARGIDVRDIARVIQVEPPTDVETYTHRSGRTGRAGKQGTSVLFVAPSHYQAIARGLARAKIAHRVEQIPRPDAIQRAREEKLVAWLAREGDGETIDPHAIAIAERIVQSGALVNAVARLIEKAGLHGPTKARDVRVIPQPRHDAPMGRGAGSQGRGPRGAPKRRRPPPGRESGVVAHDERIADRAWARGERPGLVCRLAADVFSCGALEAVWGSAALLSPPATLDRRTNDRPARWRSSRTRPRLPGQNARLFTAVTARRGAPCRPRRTRTCGARVAGATATRSRSSRAARASPRLLAQIRQVGPTSTTVLVQGETGTGKGLVARALLHEIEPAADPDRS